MWEAARRQRSCCSAPSPSTFPQTHRSRWQLPTPSGAETHESRHANANYSRQHHHLEDTRRATRRPLASVHDLSICPQHLRSPGVGRAPVLLRARSSLSKSRTPFSERSLPSSVRKLSMAGEDMVRGAVAARLRIIFGCRSLNGRLEGGLRSAVAGRGLSTRLPGPLRRRRHRCRAVLLRRSMRGQALWPTTQTSGGGGSSCCFPAVRARRP